jgi:NAD(P)-dependent dehydrogenase (short-subunit alcohol dehydrogenase family)
VITGGSSGIGLATARRFAAERAFVFITGRRQAELDKAAGEISKNVAAVKCDVSRLEDIDRLYEEVAARKGKIAFSLPTRAWSRPSRHPRRRQSTSTGRQHQRSWGVLHRTERIASAE